MKRAVLFALISVLVNPVTFSFTDNYSGIESQKVAFAASKCEGCQHASACEAEATDQKPLRTILWPLPLLLIAGGLLYFKKIKLIHFILFTAALLLIPVIQHYNGNEKHETLTSGSTDDFGMHKNTGNEAIETSDITTNSDDDFKAFEPENEGDEFLAFEEESSSGDEFSAFDPDAELANATRLKEETTDKETRSRRNILKYVSIVLLLTVIAGFLSRFRITRKYRLLFLLGGLIYMGFYTGGCPCMISSFQDVVLWMFGAEVFWGAMLWFLGLMVITYFFGRVWCGWFCHLGALQEFLYKATILKPLKGANAQKVFKILRNTTIVVLVIQIAITNSNIFIHYDPFKVAFNLFSANITGYVLLAVLLLSSLMINRPFCRGFCPVGLAMGWVSYMPGASILKPSDRDCISCKVCNSVCDTGAIVRTEKISYLDNTECIRCGNCQDSCKKLAIESKTGSGDVVFSCEKRLSA